MLNIKEPGAAQSIQLVIIGVAINDINSTTCSNNTQQHSTIAMNSVYSG